MVNERYKIAITETLHYLKGISNDDINKIPNKFMTFLKNNVSKNYECSFDYTKPLNELSLKDETRGLIAMICLNYWCETEEQKNSFKKHLYENEIKYQENLRKQYNIDNIFMKEEKIIKTEEIVANKLPVQIKKENIFMKVLKYIMNLFK